MRRVDLLALLDRLRARADGSDPLVHLERVPAREPGPAADAGIAPELAARLRRLGIRGLWRHQAVAVQAARAGRHVVVATGTASGKSLVYQLATMERFLADPRATALYVFPTKALAQDQLRAVRAFALPAVRAAVYDGDTPAAERAWVRRNANLVITNPDMLHHGILPAHHRWTTFLRHLAVVAVDEVHAFRGVFGSHVANVLRRLRRLAERAGARPVFVAASATIGNPAELAERLTGLPFEAVTEDASPRGEKLFALWNPPLVDEAVGARRSALAETADILAALVGEGVRTIAFAKSRKAAELIASYARERLERDRPGAAGRVAAYRAGYLAEERRALERALVSGELLGVAATTALELGIDIGGLDACVLAGYPGTVASTWQQAGRAGRALQTSLAVLVAGDDPLDQYVIGHPEEIFGRPHEAALVDHANPNLLDPHVACAAYEAPLGPEDAPVFGPALEGAVTRLGAAGILRPRGGRHHYVGRASPHAGVDIRSIGGVVRIVERATGALVGTVDAARAPFAVHPGAVYLHQGQQFTVEALDLEAGVALVSPADEDCYTQARDLTDVRILAVERTGRAGAAPLFFGRVEVTTQVVSYVRRRLYTGEVLDVVPLDLPETVLETQAVWYTVPPAVLAAARIAPADVAGAAHAAEHAGIGLLPLFAMCDRWDVGGVSTPEHPDTGACTVFIYDGYPGGAGIAERGFEAGALHLAATLDAIRSCRCEAGCPSCVQSPKCGNGNQPLSKDGAARLLEAILAPVVGRAGARSRAAG
jgi:DEAD/DEAH box helicase domain-containing protein